MKNTINPPMYKIAIIAFLFILIVIGFMIKLPKNLHNYDKELHGLFYFYASFGYNLFWAKNRWLQYLLGVLALVSFGVGIEIAQEASNHIFRKKIHGNFDLEDIKYNLLGLGLYSTLFIANSLYNKLSIKTINT